MVGLRKEDAVAIIESVTTGLRRIESRVTTWTRVKKKPLSTSSYLKRGLKVKSCLIYISKFKILPKHIIRVCRVTSKGNGYKISRVFPKTSKL